MVSLALSSAVYGFLALYLSFRLARQHVAERWAFWATLAIWVANSLPVYMYYHPSYAHAGSAFLTTLFLTGCQRMRSPPTPRELLGLGLLSGLMLDVYYPNGVFLLLPLGDAALRYRDARRAAQPSRALSRLITRDALYLLAVVIAFLPTLITRYILYADPLESGYLPLKTWNWSSPRLAKVLFSSNHGLFSWTPVLLPATLGLLALRVRTPALTHRLLIVLAAFCYLIAAYPFWHGASAFGNRFFVSLTPLFVLGLAAAFAWLEQTRTPGFARAAAVAGVLALGSWNVGLFVQWATGKIPDQGPVAWRRVAYNQVVAVPTSLARHLLSYTRKRGVILHVVEPRSNTRAGDSAAAPAGRPPR